MKHIRSNGHILKELKRLKNFDKDKELAEYMKMDHYKLANWKKRNSVDIYVIKSAFPEVDGNWLMEPVGPIRLVSDVAQESYPVVPHAAIDYYLTGKNERLQHGAVSFVANGSIDFFAKNIGDAMLPKYANGDILACKKISFSDFIRPGSICVVYTAKELITTRVDKVDSIKKVIHCINENSKFKPFNIAEKDILAIGLVQSAVTLN